MSRSPGILLTSVKELPFVDREEELAMLRSLFDQVAQKKGQVVFVAGEGGIGKTRLVQELGYYAKNHGGTFAVGPSYEGEGLVPYSPWIEALRSILSQSPTGSFGKALGGTLAEVGRLVPEIGARAKHLGIKGWLSGPEQPYFTVTDVERVRLFQAVTDLLTHLSEESVLVLFFDDILWADAASLQLLHYFCRRIREHRVMVVAAYRDVELPDEHRLSGLILDLSRERLLKRISLGKLTTSHVEKIVSNYLGGGPVAPALTRLIHSRTGGNPVGVRATVPSEGRLGSSRERVQEEQRVVE